MTGSKSRKGLATVEEVSLFDEIIDARSPLEFEEDRIPGAQNCPVLDNVQRVIVGTLYKQESAFAARRVGGPMVAENIARHITERFHSKPKDWRPLVYCWRGGQRSGAFVTWLRMIGWDACQLEGGYKAWRRQVITELAQLCEQFSFRVICGPTGSAKTRVLEALARQGAQTLDLEALAAHKGSVLGALPDKAQPPQKWFETCLFSQLRTFDPGKPVFVEAESRKIGRIQLPDSLINRIRDGQCIVIDASRDARIDYLVRDYAYLGADADELCTRLDYMKKLHSREKLDAWKTLARQGDLHVLYGELIQEHYDPLYQRSQNRNFTHIAQAIHLETGQLDETSIDNLASRILGSELSRAR